MDVRQLIQMAPKFHIEVDLTPISWQIGEDALYFIERTVKPGWNTLETGSGMSTVAFVLAGARHTAITRRTTKHKGA